MEYYKYFNSPNFKNMDLKLYYCGTEACTPSHAWGPGIKDHYKIHYVHSGKGILKTGGNTYHLNKGEIFLIYPDVVSYYEADKENPWSYSWVAFNGLNAESLINRTTLSKDNPVFQCINEELIRKCFNEMFEARSLDKSKDIKLLSLLYSFLAIIVEEASKVKNINLIKQSSSEIKFSDIYIRKSIEFIETNYSRRITIKEVAGHVGLSMKYLSKLFSEHIEISPQNYLINYRMDRASELLKNTPLSIVEISNSVGYNDPLLFSRIFKKYRGIAPKNFRLKGND